MVKEIPIVLDLFPVSYSQSEIMQVTFVIQFPRIIDRPVEQWPKAVIEDLQPKVLM